MPIQVCAERAMLGVAHNYSEAIQTLQFMWPALRIENQKDHIILKNTQLGELTIELMHNRVRVFDHEEESMPLYEVALDTTTWPNTADIPDALLRHLEQWYTANKKNTA